MKLGNRMNPIGVGVLEQIIAPVKGKTTEGLENNENFENELLLK